MSNYQEKYLKYKQKYLNLSGGVPTTPKYLNLSGGMTTPQKYLNLSGGTGDTGDTPKECFNLQILTINVEYCRKWKDNEKGL